jgi:hypothetical protein
VDVSLDEARNDRAPARVDQADGARRRVLLLASRAVEDRADPVALNEHVAVDDT